MRDVQRVNKCKEKIQTRQKRKIIKKKKAKKSVDYTEKGTDKGRDQWR
jgi:hypothetical protein